MANGNFEKEIHLKDYLRVIIKRKWIILTFFLVIVITVTIHSFKMKPVYEATARVLIEKEEPKVVSIEQVMTFNKIEEDYYQTQYKIIQSRSVAKSVIKKLDLKNNQDFLPLKKNDFSMMRYISSSINSVINQLTKTKRKEDNEKADLKESKEESGLIDYFLSDLKVNPIRNSRLVDISYEGHNPLLITRITNAVAEAYINHNLEVQFYASEEAKEWLKKRLDEQKEKLEESQRAFQEYKEKNNIVSIKGRENLVMQRLTELSTAFTKAKADRIEKETLYLQFKNYAGNLNKVETLPVIVENRLIQNLKEDYVKLQREFSELSKKYKEKHPKMIRLKSQMEIMENRVRDEINKVASSIETEYKVLLSREQSLKKALDEQQKEALELNQKAIQYGILEREVETNQQIYNTLLNRLKETTLTGELKTGNIRIVDRAEIPRFPAKPNKKLNILLAVVVGLTMGTGLAFFFEYLDDTINSSDDIEDYLKIPYLGGIEKLSEKSANGEKELFALNEPQSSITEAIKSVRTNISMLKESSRRSILITSTGPNEGKTVIASNLAIVLAQTGKEVLLIDADIRKPNIHKIFNLKLSPGLSEILQGENRIEPLIQATSIKNLNVITSGDIPENPSELLSSRRIKMMIEVLKKKFDYILVDSPPIMVVTDPVILANEIDDVLLVIKKGEISRKIIEKALEHMSFADQKTEDIHKEKAFLYNRVNMDFSSKIIGAVLNQIDYKQDYYYHQYHRYYKDYYSEKRV